MNRIDLFTVIWGPEMTRSFLDITVPSLLQPENIPAAREGIGSYTIYTDEETKAAISQSELYWQLCHQIEVIWEPLQKGKWEVNSNILRQMEKTAARENYMLVMSPDWALGNGSLRNMAELCAKGEHNPILYGFPRVTEGGYEALKAKFREGKPISNRQLVSLAMKHIEQMTYMVGVAMERWILSNNTWIVAHNVPTPCLLPNQEIIEIFSTNETLNSGYDHAMPYILVEKGYPWHFINHSDIYFLVERGKHIIQEKGIDMSRWQTDKALKGLRFFDQQRQTWQGV